MIQPPTKLPFSPAQTALDLAEALLGLVLSVAAPVSLVIFAVLTF